MAVSPEISRLYLRDEILLVDDLASTYRWKVAVDYDTLTVRVEMRAFNGELYVVEVRCDNYKEIPPFFEFIDPDTGENGTRHAYPKGTDSFFHESGPCICAPFNRKAYKAFALDGPHEEWNPVDWMKSEANNVTWANYSKLGDMPGLIQTRLNRGDYYRGRME
jgi:hypothetical protein